MMMKMEMSIAFLLPSPSLVVDKEAGDSDNRGMKMNLNLMSI